MIGDYKDGEVIVNNINPNDTERGIGFSKWMDNNWKKLSGFTLIDRKTQERFEFKISPMEPLRYSRTIEDWEFSIEGVDPRSGNKILATGLDYNVYFRMDDSLVLWEPGPLGKVYRYEMEDYMFEIKLGDRKMGKDIQELYEDAIKILNDPDGIAPELRDLLEGYFAGIKDTMCDRTTTRFDESSTYDLKSFLEELWNRPNGIIEDDLTRRCFKLLCERVIDAHKLS